MWGNKVSQMEKRPPQGEKMHHIKRKMPSTRIFLFSRREERTSIEDSCKLVGNNNVPYVVVILDITHHTVQGDQAVTLLLYSLKDLHVVYVCTV